MIEGFIFWRLTFGSSHCRSVRTFFYVKQTRNNVSREPTININRSTKIFVNFLTAIKYFRKKIFPPFLVAIADLTHPLSNNRSSIRIIGCLDQLLCVWATAWYAAIYLRPARGRSLAAIIRQLLACRVVPELSIIPYVTSPDWKQKKSIIIPVSTAVLPRTFVKALGATFVWLDACMCEYSREHSCVYVVGIIQYWEGVLISVLSSDPKISS